MIRLSRKTAPPVLFLLLTLLSSCLNTGNDDNVIPNPPRPDSYDYDNYEESAGTEIFIAGNLQTLRETVRSNTYQNAPIGISQLDALFTGGGTRSLRSIMADNMLGYELEVEDWLVEIGQASEQTDLFDPTSPEAGGRYGDVPGQLVPDLQRIDESDYYLFSERGVELGEMVTGGCIVSIMSETVRVLSDEAQLDSLAVDQLFGLYGAPVDFPQDGTDNSAAYLASMKDEAGYYGSLKDAFLRLRSVAEFDVRFEDYRSSQAEALSEDYERLVVGAAVGSLRNARALLSQPGGPQTAADTANALHYWSQAAGLLRGLRAVSADYRQINDEQLDLVMIEIGYPTGGEPEPLYFVERPFESSRFNDAVNLLSDVYRFSLDEIEELRINRLAQ